MSVSAALADRPIAGVNGSVSMMTKGGLNSVIQNLAVAYANDGNALSFLVTPACRPLSVGGLPTNQPSGRARSHRFPQLLRMDFWSGMTCG